MRKQAPVIKEKPRDEAGARGDRGVITRAGARRTSFDWTRFLNTIPSSRRFHHKRAFARLLPKNFERAAQARLHDVERFALIASPRILFRSNIKRQGSCWISAFDLMRASD
jgi:hypothetical protein